MNEYVKLSIDSRKNALTSAYELTEDLNKQVNDLFKQIEELGKTCTDAQDFENKFMSSELNQEYTDLFTDIAQSCKPIIPKSSDYVDEKSKAEKVLDEAASDAKYLMDDITMPARRKAREEFDSKMRETPLGTVEQASNMFHLFKRFKKQKPEEINEEEK